MQLLVNRLKFAATLTAPGCARVFVNHTLRSWLLPDLVDDAEVIVSELVTNAVQATGITDPHPTYADLTGLALLGVQVRVSGGTLFIEVWDDDREKPGTPPPPQPASALPPPPTSAPPPASGPGLGPGPDLEERGRGLVIVAALSIHHGIARSARGGKIVWAELDAGTEIAAVPQFHPTPLPRGYRRVVFSEARQPSEHAIADLALMDRITSTADCLDRPSARRAG